MGNIRLRGAGAATRGAGRTFRRGLLRPGQGELYALCLVQVETDDKKTHMHRTSPLSMRTRKPQIERPCAMLEPFDEGTTTKSE